MKENNITNHSLSLENRNTLTISGVNEIESSDDSLIKLQTSMGKLIISGSELSIDKINVDSGEFALKGQIKKLEYKSTLENGKFSSLFK